MFKKFIKMMLVLTCFVLSATGCGMTTNESQSGNGKRIAVLIQTNDDAFVRNLTSSIKNSASEKGATVTVYNSEQNSEKQIKQLKKVVRKRYDAILIRPVDADNAQEIIAIAGKIPVVFYNFQPSESVLKANQAVYVGSEEEMAGRLQANYVLKHTSKQELNVAILKGQRGIVSEKRTNTFKETLEKSGRRINYVFTDSADWEEEAAEHQMELFLKTGQPCDVIAANNDNMALGAIKAFKKAHKKLPIVCGVDASAEGKAKISTGEMGMSASQPVKIQGEKCIETALKLIEGKKITDIKGSTADGLYVYTNFKAITNSQDLNN
ncbi:sugar ABC transporter periplasmic protein [Ligilactobacillus ruminis DPC 6832]|uniref:Sugar ABC transporter periplasmic protein n=1 Tax=Ligilactobacillus ruminis DPC 6832 TaxID=1402208 RepID=A0A837DUP2_9LACO|nr:sugar ABC transporter substrate-binding protein [Ligilactobacillus ruminis]KIC05012.1 sugar ABC transporter periplasmic protein [Ligilactobacillus ruminis DPC 6832]